MRKVSAKEQLEAQEESTYISTGMTEEYDLCITDELNFTREMKRMKTWVENLTQSEGPLFWAERSKTSNQCILKCNHLGRTFKHILAGSIPEIKANYPHHRMHPQIELCMDVIQEHNLCAVDHLDSANVLTTSALFNCCAAMIKKRATAPEMKCAMANFIRSSNDNYKEFFKYITALVNKHAKLLVLRLDLTYKNNRMHGDHRTKVYEDVTYEQAKANREAFIAFIRTYFGPNLAGYAWKLEHGELRGYHYHVVIFLNGAKLREDVILGKIVGDHWKRDITNGRGDYRNCNAKKNSYRFCCVGMISHPDEDTWEGFRRMAIYLTKSDFLFKLKVPEGRCFGKGGMPKPPDVKRGRPRKNRTKPPH